MSRKPAKKKVAKGDELYQRICEILESARTSVSRTVNTTQVVANWLVGREIVEEEQKGRKRANYGEELLKDLSKRLTTEYGRGYSFPNLAFFRQFSSNTHPLSPIHQFSTHCVENLIAAPHHWTLEFSTQCVENL